MLNESEEGKTKVVRISYCFSSFFPSSMTINLLKCRGKFSAFSIHVYVTQFADSSPAFAHKYNVRAREKLICEKLCAFVEMCKELHLFRLRNSSKDRSWG
jgi:hypothetical protein